ncbi:MAG: ribose 5-phosphate isomerase [Blastocatellia bacterium]|jgi:ribose 5-phosphate isomerase B|nr:ribose 5-phosphate isomerase [Blastocatellia bacterium]
MAEDNATRDRIRALVRDVLNQAAPADVDSAPEPAGDTAPASRFTDYAPKHLPTTEAAITRDESSKGVITEDDVRGLEKGAVLRIAEGARLTPLAADIVSERQIEIVRRVPRRGSKTSKLVAVGADHGGYPMKEELKAFLSELGHRVHDFGTNSDAAVDYPDFAHAVARAVAQGTAEVGIIIDGAGVGSAMTANKVPGVRAAACYSVEVARNSREHNDANVLTLGSKTVNSAQMREIVRAWLATEISEDRHRKRVSKIEAIERQYLR